MIARRQSQDGAESAAIGRRAIALVGTALGGTSLSEVLRLRQVGNYAALLADPATMGAAALDRLLPGLVPDLLGELWVLDENIAAGTAGEIGSLSLQAAWSMSPPRYAAFVQRTLRDHPTHTAIVKLFDVDRTEDEATWFHMCANAVPLLGWPTSPVVSALIRMIEACQPGPLRDEAIASAKFALANLHLNTGDLAAAVHGYTSLIESAPDDSEVRWQAYTNRGVVAMNTGGTDIAKDDWNAVIEAPMASDESRACCLNNRADIYSSQGDHEAAIADRTAVLSLQETSYNRRYIALIRRSSSRWQLGRAHEAFEDIDSICAAEDIVTEQKMAARLRRVEWMLMARDQIPEVNALANQELREIVASRRNFHETELRARELLATRDSSELRSSDSETIRRRPASTIFAPVRGPK